MQRSGIRSEASKVELAGVRKELDSERGVIINVRQEVSSLKSDYGQKCSELKEVVKHMRQRRADVGRDKDDS